MADKSVPGDGRPEDSEQASPTASRKGSAFHGMDMRDSLAELAARAQAIGQEAAGKVAAAMREAIGSAGEIAAFSIESVRDLVQFMVKRGHITAEEGEKLLREAEQASARRAPSPARPPAREAKPAPAKAPAAKKAAAPKKAAGAKGEGRRAAAGAKIAKKPTTKKR